MHCPASCLFTAITDGNGIDMISDCNRSVRQISSGLGDGLKMTSSERCVRHITENFPMFGFGNAEAAILQCAKELIENSLDAVEEAGPSMVAKGEIHICIKGRLIYCRSITANSFVLRDIMGCLMQIIQFDTTFSLWM